MRVLCIDKSYIKQYYNGNINKAVSAMDGVIISDSNIVQAFAGVSNSREYAQKAFKRYIADNKATTIFYDCIKGIFL